jgi:predicted O-linked N-acetylglucosamine transferase (SPINDLY family)
MDLFDRLKSSAKATGKGGGANYGDEQDAVALLEEGIALEKEGRPTEALQRMDAAITLAPTLGRAHFCRGNILLDLNNAAAALDAYGLALACKPDSAASHFNMGNALARLGRQEEAADAYCKAIALKPDFADAEVALGAVLEDLGRAEDAITHYRLAVQLRPDYAEAHYNLGGALAGLGNLVEAAASFRRALEFRPDYTEGQARLGNILLEQGKPDEAAACYRRMLEILPANAEAHFKLGVALQEQGLIEEAEACYRRALEIAPDFEEAHNNLGTIKKNLGEFEVAVACYRRALEIRPGFAEVLNNLGTALRALGRLDEAAESYRRAIESNPGLAEAHCSYGSLLQLFGRHQQAESCYRRALELNPGLADAHNNLGIVLTLSGKLDEAMASYRRAIGIRPYYAEAHMNLGTTLKDAGHIEGALSSIQRALEINPDYAMAYDNLLFIHNYLGDQPASRLLADARRYGKVVARSAQPYTIWPNPPEYDRCLRVGLVSGDLCNHPVGYFLVGVLEALTLQAGNRIEFFGYANRPSDDETGGRIRACCRGWHSVIGLSDESLAKRVREDGIDILIDLSGHTAHGRLSMFAWKPAPVQVSWLGYFATTGVAEMDYFVADPWTLPASEEAYFTERVWRLPETRLCFTPPAGELEVGSLPVLANGYVTFGCFNNLTKMNDAVVDLWARVLNSVPGSRLFLKSQQIRESSVRRSVVDRFGARGIDASRMILEEYVPRANYLAAYQRVDIGLDPFPYPGGTTTVEALWMGVPVLTLAGERFLSRQGVGLLMNAGLPEWVASGPDDYVARAVSHASDLQRLAALRNGLRQQVLASPIFDAKRFAMHFENALRSMWREWCGKTRSD